METWLPGYTPGELEDAQARYHLRFPPDLVAMLRERRPAAAYDWRVDDEKIRWALHHPLDGLLFDLEHADLWWPEWGVRPKFADDRAVVLTQVVAAAPKLVPIYGHCYIPADPHAAGNPVFSIWQSDAIYYGADLGNYCAREFASPGNARLPVGEVRRRIRFWSDLVDRNPL